MSASPAQLALGWGPKPVRPDPLQLRFERWLAENPHVEALCVEIARELTAAAETRISMDMVFHVARHRCITQRAAGERFVWNNSYTSRMARYLSGKYADLRGLFETRESKVLAAGTTEAAH